MKQQQQQQQEPIQESIQEPIQELRQEPEGNLKTGLNNILSLIKNVGNKLKEQPESEPEPEPEPKPESESESEPKPESESESESKSNEILLKKITHDIDELNKTINEIDERIRELKLEKIKELELSSKVNKNFNENDDDKIIDLKKQLNEKKKIANEDILKLINSIDILIENIEPELNDVDNNETELESNKNNENNENQSNNRAMEGILKIYPSDEVNSKGLKIGDIIFSLNSNKYVGAEDKAAYYLKNLLEYVKNENSSNILSKKSKKINKMKNYFNKIIRKYSTVTPIKYPDPEKIKYLNEEKENLKKENDAIKENLRSIREELLQSNTSEDIEMQQKIRINVEKGLRNLIESVNNSGKSQIEKEKQRQSIVKGYLDVIDEFEKKQETLDLVAYEESDKNNDNDNNSNKIIEGQVEGDIKGGNKKQVKSIKNKKKTRKTKNK